MLAPASVGFRPASWMNLPQRAYSSAPMRHRRYAGETTMPDSFVPLLALALLGFLYFEFVRTKPAPRSGNDPSTPADGTSGGYHLGD
jgi:hypothetical protein